MRYLPPDASLGFLLHKVLGVERLQKTERYSHVHADTIDLVLDQGSRFAAEVIGPLNAPGDAVGARLIDGEVRTAPGFAQAYRKFVDGGWAAMSVPADAEGQGLPLVLQTAFSEMLSGACLAFAMLPVMARAGVQVLIECGEDGLLERYGRSLATGEWSATICITEPQAGSDVGRIRTMAHPGPGNSWRLEGTKIFISYAEHDLCEQIVHFALARTPSAAPGTKGLSLFLVPKRMASVDGSLGERNAVRVARLEHKMGLKASPTCEVVFSGAEAFMIGEQGQGLKNLFTMINLMRLEVAAQGVGIAEAATGAALEYAATRRQGGAVGAEPPALTEHMDVRRMLLTMRTETEAMRALVLEAAFQLDIARSVTDPDERDDAQALAELLLPVCKARSADTGYAVANLAVQVFGGHGYIAEHGVEQLVRDSRVISIYEGTNGIQAIDLVLRKLSRSSRGWLTFRRRVLDAIAAAPSDPIADALRNALGLLDGIVSAIPERSRTDNEAGAAAVMELFGIVAAGWMWLRMRHAGGTGERAAMIEACARWWSICAGAATGVAERAMVRSDVLASIPPDALRSGTA